MSKENIRKSQLKLQPKTLKKLLEFRARGKSFEALAKIFRFNSRQMVEKIVKKHRNDKDLQGYYKEIDKTFKFLNRKM